MISGADKIKASILTHSVGPQNQELATFLTNSPKFVHAEHMRHRAGSYCVSSSRAIPVSRNLEIVRSDDLRAEPVWWGREQKGMTSGEELSETEELRIFEVVYDPKDGQHTFVKTPRELAKRLWHQAAHEAANIAEKMAETSVHKSIVNRLLEPFLPVNAVVTIARPGLLNFFGLRLDRAAQPEIRVLAEKMWAVWNESEPKKLEPGQWHLPYVDADDMDPCGASHIPTTTEQYRDCLRKISAARCARTSYQSHETGRRSTIEEDLALADRLMAMRHWSPFEHQATPDNLKELDDNLDDAGDIGGTVTRWEHLEIAGNLGPGWRQWRKMMPNEGIAPLPEGYAI